MFAGVFSPGRGFVGYWCYPFYKQSSSLTLTCLMHFFRLVAQKEGRLPPILFLQMDNAAKDNKTTVSNTLPVATGTLRIYRPLIRIIALTASLSRQAP